MTATFFHCQLNILLEKVFETKASVGYLSECVFARALSKVFFMFVVLLEQTRHSTRHVFS